jgi:drug/metabolite transporter (DMT)-like permease
LAPLQFLGAGCIIGAIIFASLKLQNIQITRKRLKYGILLGIFAISMMAFGIVLVKPVLTKFQGDVSKLLWIAGFRLVPGSLVPLIIFLFLNNKYNLLKAFKDRKIWFPLIGGSVFATYLGISFWIIGMSLTNASTASILNQTATIFILIFARIFLKEPLTQRRVIAILIAMAGAYLVFIG